MLQNLSAGWGTRCVLSGLDLDVARGETLCIVGPGGGGKSTILKIISAIVGRGEAKNPVDLWWRGQVRVAAESCAHLVQHGRFGATPVSELIEAVGLTPERLGGWMPSGASERAALEASLQRSLDEVPDALRRYLSFVVAAASEAPLLLLDEPLFGLPDAWAASVSTLLRELGSGVQTMVIVTHYLPLARQAADRVMLLVDGRVIESAQTEDFFCRPEQTRTRQYLQWGG